MMTTTYDETRELPEWLTVGATVAIKNREVVNLGKVTFIGKRDIRVAYRGGKETRELRFNAKTLSFKHDTWTFSRLCDPEAPEVRNILDKQRRRRACDSVYNLLKDWADTGDSETLGSVLELLKDFA